jgi:drug/metabolite transporter (DMT)-like permease
MPKVILILLIALVFESAGVVFLRAGLKQIGPVREITTGEIARVARQSLTHPTVLLGIVLETIYFVLLLALLKQHDVSLIWPLTALGFVLTALSAKFLLQEEISLARWSGVILIVVGAGLVSWSEKQKQRGPNLPPTAGPGLTRQ